MKLIRGIIDILRYAIMGSFIGMTIVNVIDYVKAGADAKTIALDILTNIAMCAVVYWAAEFLIWIFGGSRRR